MRVCDNCLTAAALTDNAGFVAEEEIQVLSAPPDVARHFPKKLQRLCGYDCHSTAISYYADWQ
jgi:hypothetical protein